MINARMTRNGKDASDLIAALVSNVRALQNQASRLSGDLRRLRRKIDTTHRAADRLHHKIKAPMPAFGFFGRKTGYIVADRGGRVAETVVSPLSNGIDAIFQAVIIRPWEGHGPS